MSGESGYVYRVCVCGRRDGVGEIKSTVLSHTIYIYIHGYTHTQRDDDLQLKIAN